MNSDEASGLLHDAVDGRETTACPLSDFLGREEWLEQMGPGLCVHADSGITHRQLNIGPGYDFGVVFSVPVVDVDVRRLDPQTTAARHRVPAVHRQIHQ